MQTRLHKIVFAKSKFYKDLCLPPFGNGQSKSVLSCWKVGPVASIQCGHLIFSVHARTLSNVVNCAVQLESLERREVRLNTTVLTNHAIINIYNSEKEILLTMKYLFYCLLRSIFLINCTQLRSEKSHGTF